MIKSQSIVFLTHRVEYC